MAHILRDRVAHLGIVLSTNTCIRGLTGQHRHIRPYHKYQYPRFNINILGSITSSSHFTTPHHHQLLTTDSRCCPPQFTSTSCHSSFSSKHSIIPVECVSTSHFSTLPNRLERLSVSRDNVKEVVVHQKMSSAGGTHKTTVTQTERTAASPVEGDKAEVASQGDEPPPDEKKEPEVVSLSLMQRFRETYKQYGKILIAVHCVTSTVWFSSFYYLAASGLDVVALLKWMGASELVLRPFTLPGVGNLAVMYLLYKLATPLRYPVTIVGTQLAARVLRHYGHLPPIPEQNRLRSLVRDGQSQMKDKVQRSQSQMKDKVQRSQSQMKDKVQRIRDRSADARADKKDKE